MNQQKQHWVLYLLISLTVLALCIVSGCLIYRRYKADSTDQKTLMSAAPHLRPGQFDTHSATLTSIMKQQGMQQAFAYVAKHMSESPSFAKDCHLLLHHLGRDAYTYYGSYEAAIRYQNEMCNSGYTHGVLEAYLGGSTDVHAAVQTACNSAKANTYAAWQCYHGLGHGIMQASLKNIDSSLTICDTLSTMYATNACANGVYMEHFVVEDHDGNIPKTNPTRLNDCAVVVNLIYKAYCYLYAPSAYLTVYDSQYADAMQWCNQAGKYTRICVEGVGSQAMKDNINNLPIVKAVCQLATPVYRGDCVFGAVEMYINYAASSSAAEKLCSGQFSKYSSNCQTAITFARQSFGI